jgi:hypothetical protein
VNTDSKLNPLIRRQARIALDHAVLYLDGAADGIDNATKLDEDSVTSALHYPPVMHGDGGVVQVAAELSVCNGDYRCGGWRTLALQLDSVPDARLEADGKTR